MLRFDASRMRVQMKVFEKKEYYEIEDVRTKITYQFSGSV